MFKNLDNKERAYGFIFIFGIIALAFWYFSDNLSAWFAITDPWTGILVHTLLNPAYIFILFVLYGAYEFRGLIAGFLISIGFDIISLQHSIPLTGIIPTASQALPLAAEVDTSVYKIIYHFFSTQVSVFMLYVVVPILLFFIALKIIRRNASFNKIFTELF